MFGRGKPLFVTFDVLAIDGEDLRALPWHVRQRRLRRVVAPGAARVRVLDSVRGQGRAFFASVCQYDLEGITCKWRHGTYQSGPGTSWLKIRNPRYTQMEGRAELFESRQHEGPRHRVDAPVLSLI